MTQKKSTTIIGFIMLIAFLVLGAVVFFFAGFHNPHKITSQPTASIAIEDYLNVLNETEENQFRATAEEFYTVSGISPSILTVEPETWKGRYPTLEDYAYNAYTSRYKDETHWLIVYSQAGTTWDFEGMQGNDTDSILDSYTTDRFNRCLHEGLTAKKPLGAALEESFRLILPDMMKPAFHAETGPLVFFIVWEGICLVGLGGMILHTYRQKGLQNAVKVEGTLRKKCCPVCGNEYVEGTTPRCLKCGSYLGFRDSTIE